MTQLDKFLLCRAAKLQGGPAQPKLNPKPLAVPVCWCVQA